MKKEEILDEQFLVKDSRNTQHRKPKHRSSMNEGVDFQTQRHQKLNFKRYLESCRHESQKDDEFNSMDDINEQVKNAIDFVLSEIDIDASQYLQLEEALRRMIEDGANLDEEGVSMIIHNQDDAFDIYGHHVGWTALTDLLKE